MNIITYFIPRSFNKIYTHTLQIFKNFIETNLDWISGVTSHSICIHYFITSILMSFDFRGHLWPIRPFDGNSNVQNTVIDVSENVWLASFIDCGFFFLLYGWKIQYTTYTYLYVDLKPREQARKVGFECGGVGVGEWGGVGATKHFAKQNIQNI